MRGSLAAAAVAFACVAASPPPIQSPAPPSPKPSPVSSAKPVPGSSAAPVPASSPANASSRASLGTPDYRLETDKILTKADGTFTMPNKVAFSRPGSDGTADHAEGNRLRGTVSLLGNVVLHDNGKAPEANSEDEYAKGGPATLTTDQLDVDSKAKIYTAIGHVHFEQGDRKADADHGVLNRTSGMLRLQGHVKTLEGTSSLRADDIEYNLNTKHFQATGKPIIIKQPVPTPEPGSVTPSPKPKKRRLPF